MFHRLGDKYKAEKKKVKISLKKKDGDKKTINKSITSTTTVPTTIKDDFNVSTDEDFFDFVPMEYEVVEDVIIENF